MMTAGSEVKVTVTMEKGDLGGLRETAARPAAGPDRHGDRDQGRQLHLRRRQGQVHLDGAARLAEIQGELHARRRCHRERQPEHQRPAELHRGQRAQDPRHGHQHRAGDRAPRRAGAAPVDGRTRPETTTTPKSLPANRADQEARDRQAESIVIEPPERYRSAAVPHHRHCPVPDPGPTKLIAAQQGRAA